MGPSVSVTQNIDQARFEHIFGQTIELGIVDLDIKPNDLIWPAPNKFFSIMVGTGRYFPLHFVKRHP